MSDAALITKLTTLDELFTGRRFCIPDYQRGYAWDKKQVNALLDDLTQVQLSGPMHYTGTLVVVKSKQQPSSSEFSYYDIVDGQQRLTTLIILMSQLMAYKKDMSKSLMARFQCAGDGLTSAEYALRLNSALDKFFRNMIQGVEDGSYTYLAERRLTNAKKLIRSWIEKNDNDDTFIERMITVVTQRLGLIVYCPDNAEEAGMMFEVINNRGKPLSELEKVKNYLIYYAVKKELPALQKRIDEEWGIILKNLSLAHYPNDYDRQTLLRAVVVLFFGHRKTESNVSYQAIKKRFDTNTTKSKDESKKLKDFVAVLSTCSKYYELLFNAKSELAKRYPKKIIKQIALLRVQASHMSILPLYLWGLFAHGKKLITDVELSELLEHLEKLNFRVYMAPNGASRSDSGFGRLFEISKNAFAQSGFSFGEGAEIEESQPRSAHDVLKTVLVEIEEFTTANNRGGTIDNLVNSLAFSKERNFDAYRSWSRGNRYFLFNYIASLDASRTYLPDQLEIKRKDGETNDYLSLEHLWATNYSLFDESEPENLVAEKQQKARLANLLLLEMGINIAASNDPIEVKLKNLRDNANTSVGSTSLMVGQAIKAFQTAAIEEFPEWKTSESVGDVFRRISTVSDKHKKFRVYERMLNNIEDAILSFARKRWAFADEDASKSDQAHQNIYLEQLQGSEREHV